MLTTQSKREVWFMKTFGVKFLARATAFTAIAVLASTSALLAVTDEEIFRDFRFNLSNPGARSLGLGGAFIAVSDDATAALANPAGLTLLARPEFFTEIRDNNTDDTRFEDTIPGGGTINTSTRPNAIFSPSFVSYVHPFKRWAAGISRIEVNKSSNLTSNRFTIPSFDPNNPGISEIAGAGQIDTELSVWNATGAVKLGEKISVGATLAVGILNIQSGVTNTFVDVAMAPVTLFQTSIDDHDTDVAFNVGVHWRPLSRLSFGAVYRGGMNFEVQENITNDQFFGGAVATFFDAPLATTFNTPDSYGAGAAWRPLNPLTVSLDWVHIKYSDLLEGFQSGLNILNFFQNNLKYNVEDADEFHLGAEYVFTAGTVPWAVRGGAFSDHNSRLFAEFNGSPGFVSKDAFPARDTETHYTVGTGVVLKDRFQIDAAADFSQIANEYVISTIFRF